MSASNKEDSKDNVHNTANVSDEDCKELVIKILELFYSCREIAQKYCSKFK